MKKFEDKKIIIEDAQWFCHAILMIYGSKYCHFDWSAEVAASAGVIAITDKYHIYLILTATVFYWSGLGTFAPEFVKSNAGYP